MVWPTQRRSMRIDDFGDVERVFSEQGVWNEILLHELNRPSNIFSGNGRPEGSSCADTVGTLIGMDLEHEVITNGSRPISEYNGPDVRNSYRQNVYTIDLHGNLLSSVLD